MWLRPSPQSVAGYSTSSFCFPRRAPLVFADRTLTVGNNSPLTDGALAIWDCPVQHHACALSILRCGRRRRRKQGAAALAISRELVINSDAVLTRARLSSRAHLMFLQRGLF